MITLVENNNLKLSFNEVSKTLLFTDNNGYCYNICFEEKNIIKPSSRASTSINDTVSCKTSVTTKTTDKKLSKQIKQLALIIDKMQETKKTTNSDLKIDYLIDSKDDLCDIEEPKIYDTALVKIEMDLYIYQSSGWCYTGNLKGVKGEKGDTGLRGLKGDEGASIKIDYIFNTEVDFNTSTTTFFENNVILVAETGNLYTYKNSIRNKLGKINLDVSQRKKEILLGAELLKSDGDYDGINKNELRLIDFDINKSSGTGNLFGKCQNNIQLDEGTYKVKYNICWEVSGSKMVDYLKAGLLFFVYNGDYLVKNSVKYVKGFPFVNTTTHEFIVSSESQLDLTFIVKVGDTSNINFCLYGSGCFLEAEEL